MHFSRVLSDQNLVVIVFLWLGGVVVSLYAAGCVEGLIFQMAGSSQDIAQMHPIEAHCKLSLNPSWNILYKIQEHVLCIKW